MKLKTAEVVHEYGTLFNMYSSLVKKLAIYFISFVLFFVISHSQMKR